MSTIKLTNSVLIAQDSIEGDKGVNTSDLLFSQANSSRSAVNFTATKDCIVYCKTGSYGQISIDNVNLTGSVDNGGYSSDWVQIFPLRKGSVLKITELAANINGNLCKIFGLK